MKLSNHERLILLLLIESVDGLMLFTLYRKLDLQPKDLFHAVKKLKELDFLIEQGDKLKLTENGINYSSRSSLIKFDKESGRNKFNVDTLGKKLEINDFYIPLDFNK